VAVPFSGGRGLGRVLAVPLAQLRPWPENPRRIAPERLADLQRSLLDDPGMLWARPLIALSDGTVVCGNQRLLAAIELGWASIPVVHVDLDRERAQLWALRDNNSWAVWDEPLLAELLAKLAGADVELALTGFESREIDRLLHGFASAPDPDEAPPLPTGPPDSRAGEIYSLGKHLLVCGDARDRELLEGALGGARPELLLSDPPYGVQYCGRTKRALRIAHDDPEGLPGLLHDAFAVATSVLAPSARFYLSVPAGRVGLVLRLAIEAAGWHLHQSLVWVKDSFVVGFSDYQFAHEDILYGYLPGPGRPGRGGHRGSRWHGGNNESSVLFFDRPKRSELHPTAKPVALLERLIGNSSRHGDVVLDLFAGSGSTLLACERTGRRCVAVELDPAYCDVIRRRFEDFVDG